MSKPISVGDHVAGLSRAPNSAPRWWKPPLLGVLAMFCAGIGAFALIILAMGFCYLFWMEGVGGSISRMMETSTVPLNIIRVSVLLGIAVTIVGWGRCVLLRYQESAS